MRILIVGANGQVGSASTQVLSETKRHDVVALTRSDLDISNRNEVLNVVTSLSPDVVVNAAAMTNVDLCETQSELAFAINSFGVRNLTQACEFVDAHLIHLSTDFVFDGNISRPYSEYDVTNPLSVYALSKLGGDTEALAYSKSTVLRVAWVFGNENGDFFSWVLDGLNKGSIDSLIDNQISTPTYSFDVASVLSNCIANRLFGLINVANSGEATRLEMGQALAEKLGIKKSLSGITAESLNRPAGRPNYSSLSTDLLKNLTGIQMRSWQDALDEHLKRISVK
jgi:dTDP-4-dehydrorhamnose reductase